MDIGIRSQAAGVLKNHKLGVSRCLIKYVPYEKQNALLAALQWMTAAVQRISCPHGTVERSKRNFERVERRCVVGRVCGCVCGVWGGVCVRCVCVRRVSRGCCARLLTHS